MEFLKKLRSLSLITTLGFLVGCNPLGKSRIEGSGFGACFNLVYFIVGPVQWPDFHSCLAASTTRGGPSSPTLSLITLNNPNAQQWNGAVLAPNGRIYGIPGGTPTGLDPAQILVFDPSDHSSHFISFSNPRKTAFAAGALAANGKIFAVPQDSASGTNGASEILVIEPNTETVTRLAFTYSGSHQWAGATLASNQKIYAFPSTNANPELILEIDPDTLQINTISFDNASTSRWQSTILASDGKVWGIPNTGSNPDQFGIFNVTERRVEPPLTLNNPNSLTWSGSAVAGNGAIYSIPSSTNSNGRVMKVDPVTKQITFLSFNNANGYSWRGAILSSSGKIFGLPATQNSTQTVLTIDPSNDTVSLTNTVSDTELETWRAGVQAFNGKIYALPLTGDVTSKILVIDAKPNKIFGTGLMLSPYVNHY